MKHDTVMTGWKRINWKRIGGRALVVAPLLGAAVFFGGCATPTRSGALGGGAVGAGVGAIVGAGTGNPVAGAAIGGAVGAGAGAAIGNAVGESRRQEKGHYEYRTVTRPNGDTYREKVYVRD